MKSKINSDADYGQVLVFECPGCQTRHRVPVAATPTAPADKPQWGWNQSTETPTLDPSVKIEGGQNNLTCHFNLTNGVFMFHDDCTHALRGSHPLPELD